MNVIKFEDVILEELVEVIHKAYAVLSESIETAPSIASVYGVFKRCWELQMIDLLLTNSDAWEIPDEELPFIEERLKELGFTCPSYEQVQSIIEKNNLGFENYNEEYVNMAVMSVW